MDIQKALGILPPLKKRKDPGLAAVIGFLFGGIGLSIYLRSVVDAVVPVVVYIGLVVTSAQAATFGWLLGAVVSGVYGYARVQDSNARNHCTLQRTA